MTLQIAITLVILGGAAGSFASDRFRLDFVGFTSLMALVLTGILDVPEAFAGFSDPTVHMIAGLFVVGGAVFHTGLADKAGKLLEARASGSPRRLLVMILLMTALISAFLSSTGTVALMIPIVATLARRSSVSPSKLMIPLAYATLLGGMLTLIATPPNIVVSNALEHAGYAEFRFFDFTGPGLCMLAVGIPFTLWAAPRWLPARLPPMQEAKVPSARELWARYGLDAMLHEAEILEGSPLVGKTIGEAQIRSTHSVSLVTVTTNGEHGPIVQRAHVDLRLQAGHKLTVKGTLESMQRFAAASQLSSPHPASQLPDGLAVAELMVIPGSSLVGKSVKDSRLRSREGLDVLAVFRNGKVVSGSVADCTLLGGDVILAHGPAPALVRLREGKESLLLITETAELKDAELRTDKAPFVVAILIGMLVLMVWGVFPTVVTVLLAAGLMILTGSLDVPSAYRTLNWESVILTATILPMATALNKTGAIALLVSATTSVLHGIDPHVVMFALFVATSLIGLFLSNTATAVLVAPVAIELAQSLEIKPHALMMTVAIASSAAFVTPVSSPVNMLVMNAGGYKFSDFARVGVPLLLLTMLATLLLVPLFFPF